MTRLPARLFLSLAAPLALAAPLMAPVSAQQQPGTFTLPQPTPTPTPAPAGPADERAGVAIPPRAVPSAAPSPVIQPQRTPAPAPTATRSPSPSPRDILTPSPSASPRPAPQATAPAPATSASAAPLPVPSDSAAGDPLPLPPAEPQALPATPAPATSPSVAVGEPLLALPEWWPWAAGGLSLLALLGGAATLRRRRKPKALRLAAPVEGDAAPVAVTDNPRLDLTLEITGATRSVMMFTLHYRLTIANRSERAVNDCAVAVQLACARASANAAAGNAPSPGAAQALGRIARIGPHQARSITGEVQLPLAAIQPLRQGITPLFVPLVHVTLEGEALRAISKSFVIGTPSGGGAGRLHPIPLDQPPGGIAGLTAQAVAIPGVSAAA